MMMWNRISIAFLLLSLMLLPAIAMAADCFHCHQAAEFQGRVVHEPVATKDCLACHGPHVSKHEKLLLQQEDKLCYSCHDSLLAEIAEKAVLHAPLREGRCSACHDPHAAEQKGLLNKNAGELCFDCHAESNKSYQVSHPPFAKGQCSSCHAAHGGDDHRLLKRTDSALCFACHKNNAGLENKHLGRDLSSVDCLSCHNPHGGKQKNLLRAVAHAPFAEKNCRQCHGKNGSAGSCLECHEGVLQSFNFAHNHLGINGQENACISCHNPHVGDRKGLLPENVGQVCRDCHGDTFSRREASLHKHANWERCTDCHTLHGSNSVAMLTLGPDVCSLCHDQHKGFTHPIGENALDPRNQQQMDCLTCHNANDGTNYRFYLRGSGERGLCVQCHQSY